MKYVIRFEEFSIFLFSIYLFSTLDFAWWLFPLLLFLPDISMIGYLGNSKIGAIIYNVFHFRAFSLALFITGMYFSLPLFSLTGVILFAHSSLDRAFGYGLKYEDGFTITHLGRIGKNGREQKKSAV